MNFTIICEGLRNQAEQLFRGVGHILSYWEADARMPKMPTPTKTKGGSSRGRRPLRFVLMALWAFLHESGNN